MISRYLIESLKKHVAFFILLCLLGITFSLACEGYTAQAIEHRDVFVSGTEGYHTFRISAIIREANGDLLAFCEGRKNNARDRGKIDIVLKRSKGGGLTWEPMSVIWIDAENTCGNPCPVLDKKTGEILLLLTHNIGSDSERAIIAGTGEGTRTVWIMRSRDHGATWSAAEEITATAKAKDWHGYATGPGMGIQIKHGPHEGRLIIPCDHSFPSDNEAGFEYGSHAIYSDDHGKTWKLGAPIQPRVNECQIVELFDGRGTLLMDMRSYHKRSRRVQSLSTDGGVTWSEITFAKDLVGPVCQASILRWKTGPGKNSGVLLFPNPAHVTRRLNMTFRASVDNGRTWPHALVINEGPSAYLCLIALESLLIRERRKNPCQRITFATFSKSDLVK